jgi:hypothetical protein
MVLRIHSWHQMIHTLLRNAVQRKSRKRYYCVRLQGIWAAFLGYDTADAYVKIADQRLTNHPLLASDLPAAFRVFFDPDTQPLAANRHVLEAGKPYYRPMALLR